jgi:hypothetical protein
MYSDYLRHFSVEDEIVACLPGGPGRSIRLLLRRGSIGFRERDRLLVALLRPHLHAVYQDSRRRLAGVPDLTARQWELLRLVAASLNAPERQIGRGLCGPVMRLHRGLCAWSGGPGCRRAASISAPITPPARYVRPGALRWCHERPVSS